MTETTIPRTKAGAIYYPLGDEAYAVAYDLKGEVSERHTGSFWIALSPAHGVKVLFRCDSGEQSTTFHINRRGVGAIDVGIYVDGEMVHKVDVGGYLYPGDTIVLDWSQMYDGMA